MMTAHAVLVTVVDEPGMLFASPECWPITANVTYVECTR